MGLVSEFSHGKPPLCLRQGGVVPVRRALIYFWNLTLVLVFELIHCGMTKNRKEKVESKSGQASMWHILRGFVITVQSIDGLLPATVKKILFSSRNWEFGFIRLCKYVIIWHMSVIVCLSTAVTSFPRAANHSPSSSTSDTLQTKALTNLTLDILCCILPKLWGIKGPDTRRSIYPADHPVSADWPSNGRKGLFPLIPLGMT